MVPPAGIEPATFGLQNRIAGLILFSFSTTCCIHVASTEKRSLSRGHFFAVVAAWKQVTVDVHCQYDRTVPHALLHDLGRKSKSAVLTTIDTPRGIEVTQRMHAGVLRRDDRLAILIGARLALVVHQRNRHSSVDLRRHEAAPDDVAQPLDVAVAAREDEVEHHDRLAVLVDLASLPQRAWQHDRGVIDLGHCEHEGNKEDYQGVPHDLKAFDEITQFTESQYTYIIGWNRSANPKQRCRVVCTGNPPSTAEGQWVIRRWGPWLDPTHPNPAKPGELRFFTTIDGEDTEVDEDYVGPKGERPRSRTFIPSSLEDNPDLADTGYAATIEAMPEPLRTMLREGRFDVGQQDDRWQVIPSDWIRQAQARWKPDGWRGLKMTAIGVDIAQGGKDGSSFAPRYGTWFAPLIRKKGVETPDGPSIGAVVLVTRRDGAVAVLDVGGGYGGDAKRFLSENNVVVAGFNGAHASTARTADKALGFKNKRAEAIWRFREALDPGQEGGSPIALPPDPMLVADLVSYRWKPVGAGNVQIESKEEIRKRIGRSPDDGDATIMSWSEGQRLAIRKLTSPGMGGRQPQVKLGYANLKRGRTR